MPTEKQLITKINKRSWNNALLYHATLQASVVKGFIALSKDRKTAANAFGNPLETQFQVPPRGLKLFGNALEILCNPFGSTTGTMWLLPFKLQNCADHISPQWNSIITLLEIMGIAFCGKITQASVLYPKRTVKEYFKGNKVGSYFL